MTVKYPALAAVLEQHTVDTGRGRMAGFLVRCSTSRKDLGYVWAAGASSWRWRTPDGTHYGERSSQRAAVQVLREAYDVAQAGGGTPRALPFPGDQAILAGWRAPLRVPPMKARAATPPAPKLVPPPHAAPPVPAEPPLKKIVWTTQAPGVTAALDAALNARFPK